MVCPISARSTPRPDTGASSSGATFSAPTSRGYPSPLALAGALGNTVAGKRLRAALNDDYRTNILIG